MDPLAQKIIGLLNHNPSLGIEEIMLYGSRTSPELIDQWSDVDLEILVKDNVVINPKYVDLLTGQLGQWIGRELLSQSDGLLCRTVIDLEGKIELIDLKIIKQAFEGAPQIKMKESRDEVFWFKFFLSAAKFMRGDHLIGTHLLLDNWKRILELHMMDRDRRKQTNIHRFGEHEDINALLSLDQFQLSNKNQIQHYLVKIALNYDQIMTNRNQAYEPKTKYVSRYLKKGNI